MEPASTIISRFGGPTRVASILGIGRVRVSNWKRPRDKGGTGGRVPQDHHPKLLAEASRLGIALAAEDFLPPSSLSLAEPAS
ncbi:MULTISPECIES: hypothetical protein [unclassified Bosea (in: a-proteobacteria)]|uniref:hypothetical protein n=1 Tax=unclassified Bosea (in: a-proteobacteria) TaxID=2653178 RepID=UPI000F7E26C9|nr:MULTISPECIES: hypothetical protein [unclassified Bosea (in: a-proteobacteria)]RXT18356.1 hypothetical protein B5U98_24165 [Bosea sp. Tri-39]RXT32952.1 hypothetical protein B5U99_30510 [Bosea sp. Tri-54]